MARNILFVVGARPNFMKIAPLLSELSAYPRTRSFVVHTGQHYDTRLSQQFFDDLELPAPDVNLGVGSASHGVQTGEIMKRIEPVMERLEPDCTVVVGDVNSTMAAALVAAKLQVPVVHVEAGLRSFDRSMPEEVNRVVTDVLSELLFVTEPIGLKHLKNEGIAASRTHLVGDVMIDSVVRALPKALEASRALRRSLGERPYGLLTFHRPVNVDDRVQLEAIVEHICAISRLVPFLFPVHPRTRRSLETHDLLGRLQSAQGVFVLPPLGYLEFLGLLARARLVLTDSGGIQAEAAYLQVQCLTLRDTTERPETVEIGANKLLGANPRVILDEVSSLLASGPPQIERPALMDGKAGKRIARTLSAWLDARAPESG